MAVGPENTFRASVHRLLGEGVYHVKMHNDYVGGIPDDWYSGKTGDMWIEYKFVRKPPKRSALVPDLSGLQKDWLRGRWDEGRCVYVIVGSPNGGTIFADPDEWENGLKCPVVRTRQWIAEWISKRTTGAYGAKAKTGGRGSRKRISVQDSADGAASV